jgi:membrane fusion protein (multidrug efflux system)
MGDYRTTTGEAPPLPAAARRRRIGRISAGAAAALAILGAASHVIRVPRAVRASGYVTTEDYAEVRPAVSGAVAEILVRTGAAVEPGALLARLDDVEQRAALEEARSQARKAESERARREAEIAVLKQSLADQIAIADLRHRNAQTKHARARELSERGLAAAGHVEDVRLQEQVAAAELEALRTRDLAVFDREMEGLRHEVEARREAAGRAEALVRQREVRAPIGGQAVRYDFVAGEMVKPDSVMYEIYGGSKKILKLRIDERHATRVAPGQRYRAELASYGGLGRVWFDGRIEYLRNVIQADGSKTYRTAYATFDARGLDVPPGTTAEARIHTGRARLWAFALGLY